MQPTTCPGKAEARSLAAYQVWPLDRRAVVAASRTPHFMCCSRLPMRPMAPGERRMSRVVVTSLRLPSPPSAVAQWGQLPGKGRMRLICSSLTLRCSWTKKPPGNGLPIESRYPASKISAPRGTRPLELSACAQLPTGEFSPAVYPHMQAYARACATVTLPVSHHMTDRAHQS
jgi:hypothetical protein